MRVIEFKRGVAGKPQHTGDTRAVDTDAGIFLRRLIVKRKGSIAGISLQLTILIHQFQLFIPHDHDLRVQGEINIRVKFLIG